MGTRGVERGGWEEEDADARLLRAMRELGRRQNVFERGVLSW
jgi:hypothetical protein